jgi:hypothetical protein
VNVTALVTGLGIAGVAVALAVQNVLGDVLASLSIALGQAVRDRRLHRRRHLPGDRRAHRLKTTRLRSLTGEQIVIANAELLKARVRNFQRLTERRAAFTLTFPLDTPPEVMERIPVLVRAAVEAESPVRFDRSHFSAITDQTLAVETVYFVLVADYRVFMDIQQRINLALPAPPAAEGGVARRAHALGGRARQRRGRRRARPPRREPRGRRRRTDRRHRRPARRSALELRVERDLDVPLHHLRDRAPLLRRLGRRAERRRVDAGTRGAHGERHRGHREAAARLRAHRCTPRASPPARRACRPPRAPRSAPC